MEGTRLTQRWQDAQELRIEAAIKAGGQVVAEAQLLVDREPLRERRWALLALALYRAGRQGEALRTLRQVRRELDTKLGIDPSPEIVELERAILNQDDSLLPVEALAAQSGACPYPGLVPYQVQDSDSFFGREADTRTAWAGWQSGRSSRSWVRRAAASPLWFGQASQQRFGGRARRPLS